MGSLPAVRARVPVERHGAARRKAAESRIRDERAFGERHGEKHMRAR